MSFSNGKQALVVIVYSHVGRKRAPLQRVNRVARVVTITVAAFGAKELLTSLNKWNPLWEIDNRSSHLIHFYDRGCWSACGARLQFIVESLVVMRLHIVYGLSRRSSYPSICERAVIGSIANDACLYVQSLSNRTGDKTLIVSVKDRSLYPITNLIIESCYSRDLSDISLRRRVWSRERAWPIPTFT